VSDRRYFHQFGPAGALCHRDDDGGNPHPDASPCPVCVRVAAGSVLALDLVARAGITYRQLDHWTRTGLLRPDPAPTGSGYPRTYSPTEAETACAIGALVGAGVGVRVAVRVARRSPGDARRAAGILARGVR